MLLVEQNANLALGIADYGYIMENGRIVLDGDARRAPGERGREGVLPGRRRRRGAVPQHEVLQAPEALALMVTLRRPEGPVRTLREGRILDPGSRRSPPPSGAPSSAAASPPPWRAPSPPRRACAAHARGGGPRTRRTCAGSTTCARIPVTRKDDLPRLQAEEPPFGGLAGRRARRARPRVHVARPHLRSAGRGAGLLAVPPRARGGGVPRRRRGARLGLVPPHPARLHARRRGPRARVRHDPGRRRPDRAPGEGRRAPARDRLPRDAELPPHAPPEGARGGRAARARGGLRRRRDAARVAPHGDRGVRRPRAPGVRHRGPRLPRLRVRREGRLAPAPRVHRGGARPRDAARPRRRASPARWSRRSSTRRTRSCGSRPATSRRSRPRCPAAAGGPRRSSPASSAGWATR